MNSGSEAGAAKREQRRSSGSEAGSSEEAARSSGSEAGIHQIIFIPSIQE